MDLYERSLTAFRTGDTDQAADFAEQLLNSARTAADVEGQVNGLCMLARVALRRGQLQLVARLARQARRLAQEGIQHQLERMPIHMEAVAARMSGDFTAARLLYGESIELNQELGEERMVA